MVQKLERSILQVLCDKIGRSYYTTVLKVEAKTKQRYDPVCVLFV
jgi:hypothetical protein